MIDESMEDRGVKGYPMVRVWLIVAPVILVMTIVFCGRVGHAAEINDADAIKAIMGEASNQGFEGMTAIGEAIRNRGSLNGVYGLTARHIYKEPSWVWVQAEKAWKASKTSNLTHGSRHWENIRAFGTPYWAKGHQPVVTIKDHAFYNDIK